MLNTIFSDKFVSSWVIYSASLKLKGFFDTFIDLGKVLIYRVNARFSDLNQNTDLNNRDLI